MSLLELQSSVPGPVSKYGRSRIPAPAQAFTYNGTLLPKFLKDNGGDPRQYRRFLRQNKIGDAFDLQPGVAVVINQTQKRQGFSTHPEA